MGVPTVVLPYVNTALAAHRPYRRSVDELQEMGVLIGSYEPHRPKSGGGADRFPWEEVVDLLAPLLNMEASRSERCVNTVLPAPSRSRPRTSSPPSTVSARRNR